MPRNTREWAHRKTDQAAENINWALTHIEEVRQLYQEQHPEVADPYNEVQKLLVFSVELLDKIKGSY